ncbi:MAG: hypothetical protein WA981_02125 [Glaciecola sp.]
MALLLIASSCAYASDEWVMYARNFNTPHLKQSILSYAEKTETEFGEYTLVSSQDMEQGRAFAELVKGNIDIFIGAPTKERERLARAIYVPLDRGMLGFRICLIHTENQRLMDVDTPQHIINKNLSVGLGSHWPDKSVYTNNGFDTVTSPIHDALYGMLHNKRFDCLTRSVNEIKDDLNNHPTLNIKVEPSLMFIYPLGDFIFVNANNHDLFARLHKGVHAALKDNSFYDAFDQHYSNDMRINRVNERKLIFLQNNNISEKARNALNTYGITSILSESAQPADETNDSEQ